MLLRNRAVLWRELDGEAILLDPQSGYSYSLNAVGTLIWIMLDGTHSLEDIAGAICEKYEVEQAQAIQDIDHLVMDLRTCKLLSDQVSPSQSMV
jgi:hypothetical protein